MQGQSILKEMNPEYSLERLMLKLKFQYFDHLMWRGGSLEKILMLGKIEVRRRKRWQRMRWLDGILTQWTWVWASSRRWWRTGKTSVRQSMGSQRVRHDWATELNRTEPNWTLVTNRQKHWWWIKDCYEFFDTLPIDRQGSWYTLRLNLGGIVSMAEKCRMTSKTKVKFI